MNQHTYFPNSDESAPRAHSAPALRESLKDLVAEYTAKLNGGAFTREADNGVIETVAEFPGIEAEARAFQEVKTRVKSASALGSTWGGEIFNTGREPEVSIDRMKTALLKSAWRRVYEGLPVKDCASAKDRKAISLFLENPPEFTLENIKERFGAYLLDPRFHILKGLAECFCDLDPAYKSHSKVAIGVAGLPKRIIINHVDSYLSSWGGERVKDALNALRLYRGEPRLEYAELSAMMDEAKRDGEADFSGGSIRLFKNGNAHLIFDKWGLLDINKALAKFYGEVLPDAPSAAEAKRPSTEVSRALQFYPSPLAVLEAVAGKLDLRGNLDVLEPSCGDGAIMDFLHTLENDDSVQSWQRGSYNCTGIEYDVQRCSMARTKGHAVMQANFLQVTPEARFDLVFMNPPFYGQHYKKHLDHAVKFLKPGGVLACILPATAYYDHGNAPGPWHDLPVGSFAGSGTNVPTGFCIFRKPG